MQRWRTIEISVGELQGKVVHERAHLPRQETIVGEDSADRGHGATPGMRAHLGRAACLGERAIGAPDAGATAVLVWMRAVATVLV